VLCKECLSVSLCALAACGEAFVIRAAETKRPLFNALDKSTSSVTIRCTSFMVHEDKLTVFDWAGFE